MAAILLIEDDEDIRLNVTEVLTLAQHKVIPASNGMDGIEKARSDRPDLIISDVMMPVMDGFGVLHILRKNPATRNIPFIFLTSKGERPDLRHAMNLGADYYIVKPFEGSDLLDAVEARLKQAAQRESIADAVGSTTPDQQEGKQAEQVLVVKDVLKEFMEGGEIAEFRKRQIIYKEGSNPRYLYFVRKGKVRTYKRHEDGKDLVMGFYGKNDYVGYPSLMENVPHIATAEAVEDSELVLIPKKDFQAIMNGHPEVAKMFTGLLAKKLAEIERQLVGAAYNTLRQKVASALLMLREKYSRDNEEALRINMSREELANIAGTATESLIRTLTDFRQEKLIDMQNGIIIMINEKKLQNMLK